MKHKEKLIKIAYEVTKKLKALKNVKAVAIGGGIVSGYPDEFSDIDIYCLCDNFPLIKERTSILEKLGVDRIKKQYNNPEFKIGQDLFYYKGKAIGIDYFLISDVEKSLKEIKERGYIIRHDSQMVNRFIYNLPVSDPKKLFLKYGKFMKSYIKGFRVLARYYWGELKKVNKKDDWVGGGKIQVALKRKNYIWIGVLMNTYLSQYLVCLYALNNTYYHDFLTKWSFKKINDFKYKPRRCVERLEEFSVLGNNNSSLKKKLRIFKELIKDSDHLMRKL